MNCNVCHRYESHPGAQSINRAKVLVREAGCRARHPINGRGGLIGPDLTGPATRTLSMITAARPPQRAAWQMTCGSRALCPTP
jgi:hypothetical protein